MNTTTKTQTPKQRHEALLTEILNHSLAYHGDDDPTVPDAEYDRLKAELRAIEAEHPELAKTISVGAPPRADFKRVRHQRPMLSLRNAHDADDVVQFLKTFRERTGHQAETEPLHCELKIDGMSLSLHYELGHLVRAVTRGDGEYGEDVTHNALVVESIPQFVQDFKGYDVIEVRGEIVIHRDDFKQMVADGAAATSPRNFAAGSMRQHDIAVTASRHLQFYAWQIPDAIFRDITYQHSAMELLARNFQTTQKYNKLCIGSAMAHAHWLKTLKVRDDIPFECDGTVLKIDSLSEQWNCSTTPHDAHRWAIAYKFPPPESTTKLLGVLWQCTKTGAMAPVAELEPVIIDGALISRATLHNWGHIRAQDFRIGELVSIYKAGGIIPKINTIRKSYKFELEAVPLPTTCGRCQSALVVDGDNISCPNTVKCPAQIEGRIAHFCSRDAMDIRGVGASFIEVIVKAGLVKTVADLYTLHTHRALLDAQVGFGSASTDRALAAIEASKSRPLHALLHALAIPGQGKKGARQMAERCGSMDNVKDAAIAGDCTTAGKVERLRAFFSSEHNLTMLDELEFAGLNMDAE